MTSNEKQRIYGIPYVVNEDGAYDYPKDPPAEIQLDDFAALREARISLCLADLVKQIDEHAQELPPTVQPAVAGLRVIAEYFDWHKADEIPVVPVGSMAQAWAGILDKDAQGVFIVPAFYLNQLRLTGGDPVVDGVGPHWRITKPDAQGDQLATGWFHGTKMDWGFLVDNPNHELLGWFPQPELPAAWRAKP